MKKVLLPVLLLLFVACKKNTPLNEPAGNLSKKAVKSTSSLLSVPFRTDSVYGANVHFGQLNNIDYVASKIGFAISLAKQMNFNYLRTDVSMSSSGVPSNPAFQPFVDSAYNNGIGILAVINNPTANDIVAPGTGGYTTAQLNTYYQNGYNKGYGFTSRPGLQGKIQFIEIYNELENDDTAGLKVDTYGGTQEATVGQNDQKYNMTKYPAYLQYMMGLYAGIKAANSSVKVGTNYAWIHYGLLLRFAKDMLAQNKKLDFMLLNWYNVEEYGIDNSHNVYSRDTAMAGQAIIRLKYKFLTQPTAPLVTQVGLSETGVSFGGGPTPNPNNLGKGGILKLMHDQYKPQCNFLFYYELFKEPNTKSQYPKEAQFGIQIATNPTNSLVRDTLAYLH